MKQLIPLCKQLMKEAADLHLEWRDLMEALTLSANDYPQFREEPPAEAQKISKKIKK